MKPWTFIALAVFGSMPKPILACPSFSQVSQADTGFLELKTASLDAAQKVCTPQVIRDTSVGKPGLRSGEDSALIERYRSVRAQNGSRKGSEKSGVQTAFENTELQVLIDETLEELVASPEGRDRLCPALAGLDTRRLQYELSASFRASERIRLRCEKFQGRVRTIVPGREPRVYLLQELSDGEYDSSGIRSWTAGPVTLLFSRGALTSPVERQKAKQKIIHETLVILDRNSAANIGSNLGARWELPNEKMRRNRLISAEMNRVVAAALAGIRASKDEAFLMKAVYCSVTDDRAVALAEAIRDAETCHTALHRTVFAMKAYWREILREQPVYYYDRVSGGLAQALPSELTDRQLEEFLNSDLETLTQERVRVPQSDGSFVETTPCLKLAAPARGVNNYDFKATGPKPSISSDP